MSNDLSGLPFEQMIAAQGLRAAGRDRRTASLARPAGAIGRNHEPECLLEYIACGADEAAPFGTSRRSRAAIRRGLDALAEDGLACRISGVRGKLMWKFTPAGRVVAGE